MTQAPANIIYTHTDEAPALATYSLLPIIQAFTAPAGVTVETRDISLAGRVIAAFPERLNDAQRLPDALAELGELTHDPQANIIKLPNISASIPQLRATIGELQARGYDLPNYPDEPATDGEHETRARYDRIKGSAVNPVLREGNSDRRAPKAVKDYARKNPHPMGHWAPDSNTHVAHMSAGDFRANERSTTVASAGNLRIEHVGAGGHVTVLKDAIPILAGEVIDATVMSKQALVEFLATQVDDARARGVLFSLHLKATMMKVSDPIIFGHGVRAYFAELFAKHGARLDEIGANANNGLGNILAAIEQLPDAERAEIEAEIEAAYARGPGLADGRLRPRHHQPARSERHHHRRVDAGHDSSFGPDVERRGGTSRRKDSHPRQQLRGCLCGHDRLLPRTRRVRPDEHGKRLERRFDGAAGRGIRLPRQDVRAVERWRGARGRRQRRHGARTQGRAG